MKTKVLVFVQARMTSTRLPGKVLREVLGKPLLSYQIERLRRVKGADGIVVATTDLRSDDPIAALCEKEGVAVARGSEHDVLARFHDALVRNPCDAIVRVTADCPLIDFEVVDKVIALFDRGGVDYVSNVRTRTYPRGLDVEIVSAKVLREAFVEARKPSEREHVTPFFYTQPERYRLASVENPTDESRHRWTVDVSEDFELVRRILEELYPSQPDFKMNDVLAVLARHPEWPSLNAAVEQKPH